MVENSKIKSTCRGCHGGCGVLIQVEGGRVMRVEGDPQGPANKGRLCIKGKMAPYLAHHPQRQRGGYRSSLVHVAGSGLCGRSLETARYSDGETEGRAGWTVLVRL